MLNQLQTPNLVLPRTTADPGHFVQFYDEDAFPDQAIGDFLSAEIRSQGSAVVIATPEHLHQLRNRLAAQGGDLDEAERKGRLKMLDAQVTLAQFTDGGIIDPARATAVLGGVLDESVAVSTHASGRAFGEMVALLAAQGYCESATELERVWGRILQARPFQLFCAYPIRQFLHESMRETFQHICDEHDEVIPVQTWLGKPKGQGQLLAMMQQQAFTLQREMKQRQQAEAELRASHHELRALAAHLQLAREEERARLARELHDELGQTLSVLKMSLSRWNRGTAASQTPAGGGPNRNDAVEMMELTDQSIQSLRRILKELRPPEMDLLGLQSALEAQVQEFQHRTGIEARFTCDVNLTYLDESRALALFRIVQESLTNVARHSGASAVEVSLTRSASHWMLQVRDNGNGLKSAEPPDGHWGIVGMRERALLLGGSLSYESIVPHGTVVSLKIPMPAIADGARRASKLQ